MFSKSNKEYESIYKKGMKEFDSFLDKDSIVNEQQDILELYNKVKLFYDKRMLNNELDIEVEKIRIHNRRNTVHNLPMKIAVSIGMALVCAAIPLGLQVSSILSERIDKLMGPMGIILFMSVFFLNLSFILKSHNLSQAFYNVCLSALNNIEKQIEEERIAEREEMMISEISRGHELQNEKTNVFSEVIMPAVLEIAASKVGGFILGKLRGKSKRK